MDAQKPWRTKWIEAKPLGAGGQGDTYIVKSVSNEEDQAVLKVLRPHKAQEPKARRRMFQEVNNLRVLHSAGGKVPEVLEHNTEKFEDANEQLFLVMEYVRGLTLADTFRREVSLSVEASVGIALDLCKTLSIAVREGIAHRDIKPENLIIRSLEPPDVVVVDFGLSFNEDDTTNLTETEETLDNKFVSLPERRGPGENKRDFRSDITGICAILFYCLTGCSPRNLRNSQGKPPHRWTEYALTGKIKDEKQLSSLNLLLDRGLSYEIDSRFQTVDELVTRLREVVQLDFVAPGEDLDVVIARETAALRRTDRRTQLAECWANAQTLNQSLIQCLNEIGNKLMNQKTFTISWNGLVRGDNKKSENGEIIAIFAIGVAVPIHNRQIQTIYTIASKGTECAVYRKIVEIIPGGENGVESPVLVMRYLWDTVPGAATIIADIKQAVAKVIATLSARIQSGA